MRARDPQRGVFKNGGIVLIVSRVRNAPHTERIHPPSILRPPPIRMPARKEIASGSRATFLTETSSLFNLSYPPPPSLSYVPAFNTSTRRQSWMHSRAFESSNRFPPIPLRSCSATGWVSLPAGSLPDVKRNTASRRFLR